MRVAFNLLLHFQRNLGLSLTAGSEEGQQKLGRGDGALEIMEELIVAQKQLYK